jgi:hypothetical protein
MKVFALSRAKTEDSHSYGGEWQEKVTLHKILKDKHIAISS